MVHILLFMQPLLSVTGDRWTVMRTTGLIQPLIYVWSCVPLSVFLKLFFLQKIPVWYMIQNSFQFWTSFSTDYLTVSSTWVQSVTLFILCAKSWFQFILYSILFCINIMYTVPLCMWYLSIITRLWFIMILVQYFSTRNWDNSLRFNNWYASMILALGQWNL